MIASKCLMVSGAVLLFQAPAVWAQDQDHDLGKVEYQSKCASCHGSDAKGDGPIADQLKTPPADLTQLAKKNGGVFPLSAVYEKIDGRQEVKAHGRRDMPVWGYRYFPSPNPTPNTKPMESWSWLDMPDPEAVFETVSLR
jgi:mono/diheme cytochrome c family protein